MPEQANEFRGPLIIVGTPMFKRPKLQITRLSKQFGTFRRPITVQSAISVGIGAILTLAILQGIFGAGNLPLRIFYLVLGGTIGWVLGNTTKRGDTHWAALTAALRRSNSARRYVGVQPLHNEPLGPIVLAHAAVEVSSVNYTDTGERISEEAALPAILPSRKPDLFN